MCPCGSQVDTITRPVDNGSTCRRNVRTNCSGGRRRAFRSLVSRPIEQRAVFHHQTVEQVGLGKTSSIVQFPAGDQQQLASRIANPFEGVHGPLIDLAPMRQGAIVIAGQGVQRSGSRIEKEGTLPTGSGYAGRLAGKRMVWTRTLQQSSFET